MAGNGTSSTLFTEAHLGTGNNIGTLPVTGIVHAGPASPIALACEAISSSGVPLTATVDGVQLATANGHVAALHRTPNNSYRAAHKK